MPMLPHRWQPVSRLFRPPLTAVRQLSVRRCYRLPREPSAYAVPFSYYLWPQAVWPTMPQPLERHNIDVLSFVGETPESFKIHALARSDLTHLDVVKGRNHRIDTNRHRSVDVTSH